LALTGRQDGYLAGRKKLLETARANGHDVIIHANAILACLAVPTSDEVQTAAIQLAAVTRSSSVKDAWITLAQALAAIRAGKAKEALTTLMPTQGASDAGVWLLSHAMSALAHKLAGDAKAAQQELAKINSAPPQTARFLSSPAHRDAALARLLIREAQ
jgi:hypothetical protein